MDITEIILHQHAEQRRGFALLDDVARDDAQTLRVLWSQLEALLESHAKAEELFFYPRLLELGVGPEDDDGPDAETEDAIKDHNEIRDAVRRVSDHPVGTDAWWQGVLAAREANSDHMAEEEREDLPDFRRHADVSTRHELAIAFIRFQAEHADGVPPVDEDPQAYVKEHGRD